MEYAQSLVARGNTTTQTQAHMAHLQSLIKENQPNEIKSEIKPKTGSNNKQIHPKSPNTNPYLLIGGLILLLGSVLAIGCWLGKRKKSASYKNNC